MTTRNASAITAALVAGLTVWGFSHTTHVLVWATFIGWASYDHSGADRSAMIRSTAGMLFGAVMGFLVSVASTEGWLPGPSSLTTALWAAAASLLIVLASVWTPLSIVPSAFYGFASVFAYVSLTPDRGTADALTAWSAHHVLAVVPVSLLIGTALGVVQSSAAGWLHAAADASDDALHRLHLDGSHIRRKAQDRSA